eukprot:Hpha_TRINITY_DN15460_c2_g8::TRINITY_DN15460_c2_g8_i1::g.176478::m.176478
MPVPKRAPGRSPPRPREVSPSPKRSADQLNNELDAFIAATPEPSPAKTPPTVRATRARRQRKGVKLPVIRSLAELELIGRIGQSATSRVFRMREKSTGGTVAVKVVPVGGKAVRGRLEADVAAAERSVRTELDIHSKLCHRHIVRLFDAFPDEEQQALCLVMEDCPGGDLSRHLESRLGKMSEAEIARFLLQIASAVAHLHSRSPIVLHRDIKLENVFVAVDGTLRLGDFGSAAKVRDVTQRRETICGTVDYLAPEMVLRKGSGTEADVWAFGVLCHELIVGSAPFAQAGDLHETVHAIGRAEKEGVRIDPDLDISDPCREFLSSLLAPKPGERLTMAQVTTHPFLTRYLTNLYPVLMKEDPDDLEPRRREQALSQTKTALSPTKTD